MELNVNTIGLISASVTILTFLLLSVSRCAYMWYEKPNVSRMDVENGSSNYTTNSSANSRSSLNQSLEYFSHTLEVVDNSNPTWSVKWNHKRESYKMNCKQEEIGTKLSFGFTNESLSIRNSPKRFSFSFFNYSSLNEQIIGDFKVSSKHYSRWIEVDFKGEQICLKYFLKNNLGSKPTSEMRIGEHSTLLKTKYCISIIQNSTIYFHFALDKEFVLRVVYDKTSGNIFGQIDQLEFKTKLADGLFLKGIFSCKQWLATIETDLITIQNNNEIMVNIDPEIFSIFNRPLVKPHMILEDELHQNSDLDDQEYSHMESRPISSRRVSDNSEMATYSRSMSSQGGDTLPLLRGKRYVITSLGRSSRTEDVVSELIQNELENETITEFLKEESDEDESQHSQTTKNDTIYEPMKGKSECNFQDSDEQYEEIQLSKNSNEKNQLKEHPYANIFEIGHYLE